MWNNFLCGLDPNDWIYGGKKKPTRKIANLRNTIEYQNQLAKWLNIALNVFKYNNLPETCDPRILEMSFLTRGCASLIQRAGVFLTLLTSGGYNYNINFQPTRAHVYGANGDNFDVSVAVAGADQSILMRRTTGELSRASNFEGVFAYDNDARYPYINFITSSCQRLADIRRSEDVVRENSKKTAIVTCEDSELNSVRDAFSARDENNAVYVMSAGSMALDALKVWPLQIDPTIMKEFADAYEREDSYLRTVFGIDSNPDPDKKERLIVPEATSNNAYIQMITDSRLTKRKEFCDAVNLAFGLDISVDLNQALIHKEPQQPIDDGKGGNPDDEPAGI